MILAFILGLAALSVFIVSLIALARSAKDVDMGDDGEDYWNEPTE